MTRTWTGTTPSLWGEGEDYQPEPELPAPEVPARPPGGPDEYPAGARRFAKAVEATGWEVRPTYARGPWLSRSGRHTGEVADSLALRCRRGAQRAAVSWARRPGKPWSFDQGILWATDGTIWPAALPCTALRARMTEAEQAEGETAA